MRFTGDRAMLEVHRAFQRGFKEEGQDPLASCVSVRFHFSKSYLSAVEGGGFLP